MTGIEKQSSRADSLKAFKRQHILAAAKRIFDMHGMDGLNMREIAKEAGYSLGAAYAYFRTKEEIQYELLAGALGELTRHIRSALSSANRTDETKQLAFTLFLAYFQDNPKERQLLLFVLPDLGSAATKVPTQVRTALNSKLLALMGLLANELHQTGQISAVTAQEKTIDFVAFLLGLLMLENGGRLKLLNQQPQEIVDRHGKRMLLRNPKKE
ncbi:MAG: TetR/AcrR family transcriptional regulator [Sneathiella sp.]